MTYELDTTKSSFLACTGVLGIGQVDLDQDQTQRLLGDHSRATNFSISANPTACYNSFQAALFSSTSKYKIQPKPGHRY